MKHIEYISFSVEEFNALKALIESIWTSAGLDLNLAFDQSAEEKVRVEAQKRLRNTLGIAMGITAWLTPATLNPQHFRYRDFKWAFDKITERLQKSGIDVATIFSEAANIPTTRL